MSEPNINRLMEESSELTKKVVDIKHFLEGEGFNTLDLFEAAMLNDQYIAMEAYKLALDNRISFYNTRN